MGFHFSHTSPATLSSKGGDDSHGIQVVLVSIVESIPACHAGDRGSIPRRGDACPFVPTYLTGYAQLKSSTQWSFKRGLFWSDLHHMGSLEIHLMVTPINAKSKGFLPRVTFSTSEREGTEML